MTRTVRWIALLALAVISAPTVAAFGQSPAAALFREALLLERADGRMNDAIFKYERVVAEYPQDDVVTPRALDRLAAVYAERHDPRSIVMLTRLVTDFPNATPYAEEARARLATLQTESANQFAERATPPVLGAVNAMSPDGKWLLQTVRRQFVLRSTQSDDERVINLAADQGALGGLLQTFWSPSGSFVALMTASPGMGDGDPLGQVHVVNVSDLKSRTACTSCRLLAWSPDSKQLAVITGPSFQDAEIQVVTIATGAVTRLAKTTAFPNAGFNGTQASTVWSPDGRRLAVRVFPRPGVEEIRVADVATGQSSVLKVPGLAPDGQARIIEIENTSVGWTTKDELVVAVRNPSAPGSEIILLPVNGGPPRSVCSPRPDTYEVCRGLTPDGDYSILGRTDSHSYFIRNTRTGEEHPTTVSPGEEWWALMSPDGKLMSFISNREGGGKWGLYVIPIGVPPIAEPVRLMSLEGLPDNVTAYQWTTGGTLLARFGFNTSNVYRVRVNPKTGRTEGALERLTHDALKNDAPAVSPDGQQIVYRQPSYTSVKIGVMNAHGIGERPVRSVTAQSLDAFGTIFWRGPGEIVFDATDTRTAATRGQWAAPNLSVLDLASGAVQPLPHGALANSNDSWAYLRTSNELIYAKAPANGRAQIVRRSLADGTERTLVDVETPRALAFSVSADGQRLAYVVATRGSSGPAVTELRLAAFDGSPERTLGTAGAAVTPLTWSPNGRWLLTAPAGGGPRVIDVESGDQWPLVDDAGGFAFQSASWSPDGSFVVVTGATSRLDLHAWDGVTGDAVARAMSRRR